MKNEKVFIKRRNIIYFSDVLKFENVRIKGIFLMAKVEG